LKYQSIIGSKTGLNGVYTGGPTISDGKYTKFSVTLADKNIVVKPKIKTSQIPSAQLRVSQNRRNYKEYLSNSRIIRQAESLDVTANRQNCRT
jgi:hypothetical protein